MQVRPGNAFARTGWERRLAAVCSLPLVLNACATIVHGRSQAISVVSEPPGARVSIDSVPSGLTPLQATVSRGGRHVVRVAYDTFPAVTIPMSRSLSSWVFTNLFWYGATAPIDFVTGAAYRQGPETVSVRFNVSLDAAAVAARRWNVSRGDPVRFTTGVGGWTARGRFVDVDSAAMTIESAGSVTRVLRTDIRSLQRADGRMFGRGALNGMIGGAIVGAVAVAASNRGSSGYVDFGVAPAIGALVGLVISPALAPRRWVDVPRP